MGRNETDSNGVNRCISIVLCDSGGPKIDKTSGKTASSVENVRVSWSRSDLRGSTFVGDKHESNTDLSVVACWSAVKLSDCFFLLFGVLLVARKSLLRRSVDSFSRGGLFVAFAVVCCCCCCCCVCCVCCCCCCCWCIDGSEFCASGSVPAAPSFPELSFFQSPFSIHFKNTHQKTKQIGN